MGVLVCMSGMICGCGCIKVASVLGKKFQQRENRK